MKRILLLLLMIFNSQLNLIAHDSALQTSNTEDIINGDNLSDEQLHAIQRIKEKYKKDNKLQKIDEKIKQEVIKALKVCNIAKPVILLQDKHPMGFGGCIGYQEAIILVVGSNESLVLSRYAIYHECGHLINRRHEIISFIGHKAIKAASSSISGFFVGCLAYNLFKKKLTGIGAIVPGTLIGFAISFMVWKIYSKIIHSFFQRQNEITADLFAIKTLLAQNDLEALLSWVLELTNELDKGNKNGSKQPTFLITHPGHYERGELILKELKKAGINLKNIPFNLNKTDKAIMQKKVEEQITKHFPEYLTN